MLRPRLIVALLVHNGGLVKTVKFGAAKYVGDPLNAVRIFNEKEVDELIVLDIDATREGRTPDYRLIEAIASECRMPLCYGGGVRRPEEAQRIVQLGAEKVAVNAALVEDPMLATRIANVVGSQSVVGVVDARLSEDSGRYEIWTRNASHRSARVLEEYCAELERRGAGEIVINAIDRDGTRQGYDLELVRTVRESVSLPITALGGAGSLEDVRALFEEHAIIGAAAGSLFVFKGTYRAVLISYPNRERKATLMAGLMTSRKE